MKKILILFLLPLQSFAQSTFNLDTVNQIFLGIINEYRLENNLYPYNLDRGLAPFTLQQCQNMKKNGVTHGEEGTPYSFRNRWRTFIKNYPEYSTISYRGENIAMSFIPLEGTGDFTFSSPYSIKNDVKIEYHEFDDLMVFINDGNCTDSCIAYHVFYQWKNSPGHNRAMLNPDFTTIFLGLDRYGTYILSALCFIENS